MKRLLLSLALLVAADAQAARVQLQGSVPGGPAQLVAVSADARTVAITSADRVGLFQAGGARTALLSPTGRRLTSLVTAGPNFLTLDRSGTLARISGGRVTILARDLCPVTGGDHPGPELDFAAGTFAVRCEAAVLLGQPGAWQKLTLPPSSSFTGVALSRDGRQLAALVDARIVRYALPAMNPLPALTRLAGEDTPLMDNPLTPAAASALAFDPAGRRLAVGWGMSFGKAYNQSVTVYDLRTGEGRSLPTYPDWTDRLAFSADGRQLLANGISSPRLWDLGAWKRLPPPQEINTSIGVQGVAWLGSNLISASSLGAVALTPSGKLRARYPMPQLQLTLAAYSGDGRLLAVTGDNGQLHLVDARTAQVRWSAPAHGGQVDSLRFNRAGTLLVGGSSDADHVQFWDVRSGKPTGPTITGVHTVAGFTAGDRELVFGGRVVPLSEVLSRTGEVGLERFSGRSDREPSSDAADLTPAGNAVCERAAVYTSSGTGVRASLRDLNGTAQVHFGLTLPENRTLAATTADCHTLVVATQAPTKAAASSPFTPVGVEVYDPRTGKKLRSWATAGEVHSLALSPDGQWVAYTEQGREELVIGDVRTGRQTRWPLPARSEPPNVALTFRPDSQALLVGLGARPEASFTVLSLP
ncbi:WD40 repeat domain-containing protein [Deinococcus hopiensis]|uniref:WD40 repeat n=1 Tax=Deinococcus hopiensis KR-140 TaxID=695939 RepID=A0A1W1VV28_9DEIO|nr:WD40 repeat domain-containing protein [Deinococcus hopiensis]SMB97225.1 hypothetical protein SAMN00790413_06424 [Deinococcus hopiensis KR-140]